MDAVAGRRIGRQPRRLQIRVAADAKVAAVVILARQRRLGERAVGRREVDDDRVDERMRRRRVGVLDDQDERRRPGGHAAPLQRRRDALAIGGVARRNRRVVDERQARHRDLRHAGAQVDRLVRGLVEPGALVAQRMADRVGELFEQGGLLRREAEAAFGVPASLQAQGVEARRRQTTSPRGEPRLPQPRGDAPSPSTSPATSRPPSRSAAGRTLRPPRRARPAHRQRRDSCDLALRLALHGQSIEGAGLGAGGEDGGRVEKRSEVVGDRRHREMKSLDVG